ncbi:intracellular protein transport protein (Sat1) [Ophiocordyceps camponoti-floridani]|uniref:Intracellular protein transport protein (Sat1) n=1 Tax=Ophiocordyceps camponoti-floridani TaxID=2030778 RepID=A0A8H4VCU7_9HYPO|nr:intracellular protein transport protein (Sat1) [Ophiocordyceps camponoti-floridani]
MAPVEAIASGEGGRSAVSPGHVRVFVRWHSQTVFAGEEVKCTITFKNVASDSDQQKTSPSSSSQQQQQQPVVSSTSPLRARALGPMSPSVTGSARGHRRSALSLSGAPSGSTASMQWPQTSGGSDWSRRHAHKRSLSIVSIGSAAATDDGAAKPHRGHGRAASLQILPRGPASCPPSAASAPSHGAFPVVNNLSDRLGRMTAPNTPSCPGPRRSPLGSPSPVSDFRFPTDTPSTSELIEGSRRTSPAGLYSPPSASRDHGVTLRLRDHAQPPDRMTARVLSSSSAPGGTPRSSGEFYSLSNNSSETLASEYVNHRLMRGHGRQRGPSRRTSGMIPSQARAPESLMMGYAQIQGSFSLDGSLISLGPFEHVKKTAVGGRGGGVVGLEPSKRESGLLRSFGWGNLSSSLGGLLGGGELSSIKEMRGAANSKSVPLLSTPQSILFVDLQLTPGESRSFEYSFRLPKGLPPTHKGKAVKFSYSLVIGTQRAGGAKEHQVRSVDVPFRVLGSVNSQGELLGHDLMKPYVLLRDEALVRSVGRDSKAPAPTAAPDGPATMADFVSYVDGLLAGGGDRWSGTLQSPTDTGGTRRPLEDTGRAKDAIDLAIMRSNMTASGQQSANRFEISRNGRRVGVVMVTRPAYRLGEVITLAIDFSDADVGCYAVHMTLETSERVDASLAVRSESSIQRVTRKVYAVASEAALFARRLVFSPTIPVSATPEFVTSGISLEWKMRLEFVVPYQGGEASETHMAHPLLEPASHDGKGGLVLVAVEKVACESFDVSVPLRVYGAVGSGLERLERDEAWEGGLAI